MADYPAFVRKKRTLPLKVQLFGESGEELTDADLLDPPVIEVIFEAQNDPGSAVDVTAYALPSGLGSEGNELVYSGDWWRFNLNTRNYSASGVYTVFVVTSSPLWYEIDPTCVTQFVIP